MLMAPSQRPESNHGVDRPIEPLGFKPRPLLSQATAAVMNRPDSMQHDYEKKHYKPLHRREDSTEKLSEIDAIPSSSLISRFIPHREPRLKSSEIWERMVLHLGLEDMSGAKKCLIRLLKHRSGSKSAAFNRCRALALLSAISVSQEWHGNGHLSSTASRRLTEGVMLKSKDCIAFAAWLFVNNRWSAPSAISPEHLGGDLERAAVSGHVASQAVLGSILCLNAEDESLTSSDSKHGPRLNEDVCLVDPSECCSNSSKASLRRTMKRSRALKPEVNVGMGSKWLREAASQGYFLALHNIEQAVIQGKNFKKLHKTKKKELREKSCMWTAELAIEPISSEEYFGFIQNAANQQIPDSVFLMSKLLRRGIGCRKSEADSLRWAAMASEMNVPESFMLLRSRALRSNWKLLDFLARDTGEDHRKSEISFLESSREQLLQNKDIVRLCDERISEWKENASKQENIISLYRLCNLQTKFPEKMTEGLIRLIFERDRDGWKLQES